jgi:hypothetical protein
MRTHEFVPRAALGGERFERECIVLQAPQRLGLAIYIDMNYSGFSLIMPTNWRILSIMLIEMMIYIVSSRRSCAR